MPSLRAPAAPACAPLPSGSPKARRHCAPRDDRESRPPACSRRRPAPRRAPPWARRCVPRFPVARRRARRNLAQRLPDALLEGGAAHIERQVEPQPRRFDETRPPARPVRSNSASPPISMARGKRILQVSHQRVGIVAQQDRANARSLCGHQDRPQRALADGEADLGIAARRRESRSASCPESPSTSHRSGRWN